jgi:hypothetical protein
MVEILNPDGGSEIYRKGAIRDGGDSVLIIQEDKMIKFPQHRVHKMVTIEGDEE